MDISRQEKEHDDGERSAKRLSGLPVLPGLDKPSRSVEKRVGRDVPGLLCREEPSRLPLDVMAGKSSERERNAAEAEQSLVEWRIFRLLKERLGDEFRGMIVDVIKAGLLVEVDEYFVSGLLPFDSRRGDYEPKPAARRLRTRRRRKTFDLGDEVRVILVSCDPALRRMSFVPAADPEQPRS